MSFIETEVVLSRSEKAAFNSARKPKGDHREVARPQKFKHQRPPEIIVDSPFIVYMKRDGTKIALEPTLMAPESWVSLGLVEASSREEACLLV